MKTPPRRIVVIGDALIDELRDGASSHQFPGGAALNVALGLSILGIPATLIAMVGNDSDGDSIRRVLAEYSVELLATEAPLGTSRAISDRTNGEPRYIFNESARQRSIAFGLPERRAIEAADLVAVSCFPFDDRAQVEELASVIDDPAHRLAIDPNPRLGMMRNAEEFLGNFRELASTSLMTKIGDDDAHLLTGGNLLTFAEELVGDGAQSVLATAGAEGAWLLRQGAEMIHEPITELSSPVIDTMGAGDASFSSMLAGISHAGSSADWAALLRVAMCTAAATCRVEGALLRLPRTQGDEGLVRAEVLS